MIAASNEGQEVNTSVIGVVGENMSGGVLEDEVAGGVDEVPETHSNETEEGISRTGVEHMNEEEKDEAMELEESNKEGSNGGVSDGDGLSTGEETSSKKRCSEDEEEKATEQESNDDGVLSGEGGSAVESVDGVSEEGVHGAEGGEETSSSQDEGEEVIVEKPNVDGEHGVSKEGVNGEEGGEEASGNQEHGEEVNRKGTNDDGEPLGENGNTKANERDDAKKGVAEDQEDEAGVSGESQVAVGSQSQQLFSQLDVPEHLFENLNGTGAPIDKNKEDKVDDGEVEGPLENSRVTESQAFDLINSGQEIDAIESRKAVGNLVKQNDCETNERERKTTPPLHHHEESSTPETSPEKIGKQVDNLASNTLKGFSIDGESQNITELRAHGGLALLGNSEIPLSTGSAQGFLPGTAGPNEIQETYISLRDANDVQNDQAITYLPPGVVVLPSAPLYNHHNQNSINGFGEILAQNLERGINYMAAQTTVGTHTQFQAGMDSTPANQLVISPSNVNYIPNGIPGPYQAYGTNSTVVAQTAVSTHTQAGLNSAPCNQSMITPSNVGCIGNGIAGPYQAHGANSSVVAQTTVTKHSQIQAGLNLAPSIQSVISPSNVGIAGSYQADGIDSNLVDQTAASTHTQIQTKSNTYFGHNQQLVASSSNFVQHGTKISANDHAGSKVKPGSSFEAINQKQSKNKTIGFTKIGPMGKPKAGQKRKMNENGNDTEDFDQLSKCLGLSNSGVLSSVCVFCDCFCKRRLFQNLASHHRRLLCEEVNKLFIISGRVSMTSICKFCSKSFTDFVSSSLHLLSKHGEELIECTICKNDIKIKTLNDHKMEHIRETKENTNISCKSCQRKGTLKEFVDHIITSHGVEEKQMNRFSFERFSSNSNPKFTVVTAMLVRQEKKMI